MSRLIRFFSLRPRTLLTLPAIAIIGSGLGGCANQQEYDKLFATSRALEERNVALQQEAEAKDQTIALLRQRVAEGDATVNDVTRRNASLNSELIALRDNLRGFGDRLNDASRGALDPVTDRALRELASKYPQLMTFDSARGMVQFASDLTFASGSVEVKPEARASLQALAQVLGSASAANYDMRIVGHTDNVKPSRPETLRNHPTNMHLSVHRSIEVRNLLTSMGVPGERMEVSGWGENRPVVANAAGGAAPNRRVEIFLVPSTRNFSIPSESASPTSAPTQAQVRETPMK